MEKLPGEKIKNKKQDRQSLTVSALMLSWEKGKMNAATQAIHMAPLYYRILQGCLREACQESALPYINKQGETISPHLNCLAKEAVAVMHGEQYPLESPTPTGCNTTL